ncbi:MAG: type III PLP-dependent enzyme [Alteromonadaceae bacterium]|nr:type III PLP-dependent enzyme [Alteromonadaceae bacterium]
MTVPFSLTPLLQYIEQQQSSNIPISVYYYDLDHLAQRIRWITDNLPPQVQFYYAIKANSDAPVLDTLAPHVHGFEVASLGEVRQVRNASPATPLAFGGPGKTPVELEGALDAGVELYHIESRLQLVRLNTLAAESGKVVKVLLRVNPRFDLPDATLQMAGKPTQFGIDQTQIGDLLESLPTYSNIRCVGFHFHALSNNLDASSHLLLVHSYVEVVRAWQREYDLAIEVLNIGGGIGINYTPGGIQFDWRRFCQELEYYLEREEVGFKLAMECGRFVTATMGCYVTEVTDVKISHDEHFAILRGGSHHFRLPSSWQHNHPFQVLPTERWNWPCPRPGVSAQSVTLCGELCTPKDVLAKGVTVEKLRAGDVVLFEKAGAYGWHISHHDFLSHPHPDRIYRQGSEQERRLIENWSIA